MRKRTFYAFLLTLFLSPALSGEASAQSPFHDVQRTFWAVAEIEKMAEIGVVNGYQDLSFRPHNPVTREEFAALLSKSFYLDQPTNSQTFTDVPANRWSYHAIESVKDYFPGFISSPSSDATYFSPLAEATREDVAAALVRTLGYTEDNLEDDTILDRFGDAADVSPHLALDVAIAVDKGLVNGYEDGTFRPQATVTRAEAAAILYRAMYGTLPNDHYDTVPGRPAYPIITDFSQAVGWYGPVSQTTDPGRVIEGDVSVSLATDEHNTTTAARVQGLSLDLSRAKNVMLRLYIEDIENLSKFEIRLSSASNMAAYLGYAQSRWQLVQGWNEVVIPLSQFSAHADESFEQVMNVLQVSITQRGDLPASVVFDALYRDYEGLDKGKVIIQFDDGWASEYSKAYPLMKEGGFVGNIGVVSELVGSQNYVTVDQLKEMYADGWDMYSHTATHPRLSTLPEAEIEEQLSVARAFLVRHRMTRAADFIAYPYGDFDDTVVRIASKYSRYARSITPDFEVGSPINPYRLKTIELVNGIDPAVYQNAIRSAADNGTTVMFFLHRIEDTGTASIIFHTDDFQAFLDYLDASRDSVDVISISEWYKTFAR